MNADRPAVAVRTQLKPGDIGAIVRFHGVTYAREYGFDRSFEAYVAGPLAEFAKGASPRERIWVAEHAVGSHGAGLQPREDRIVGCVAIVAHSQQVAQLRWFLVDPDFRGAGLGKRLLHEAVEFCKEADYESVVLWTVSALTAAAHLYRSAGFEKVEERPGRQWSVDVVEERYELRLQP